MEYYQRYINDGYTEEQAFYLAEIKTTQRILTDLNDMGEYTPTLLLNSLLTMVVLPYEKAKQKDSEKIFKLKINDFEKRMGITPTIFQPIKGCENCIVKYNKRTTGIFINKMRNGIAHQNISVSICGDREFKITIKNKYQSKQCNKCSNPTCKEKGCKRENGGIIDFEITFTVDQLKRLSNYIANSYANALEQENI